VQTGIYIIAEVGQAHDGSLGIAHSYIDALAGTGVNAIKFQLHIAEAESSSHEDFRTNFSYLNETRMEYWKRMEFTLRQWSGIKQHCEDKNLDFIATPSSVAAVDLLYELDVDKYKIGSGDTNNLLLLDRISKTGKEIIISSGMSSFDELDVSVQFLKDRKSKVSLLQCTSAYPTTPRQWGLNVIKEFKSRYKIPVGFSDHSGTTFACLSAASRGAEILEFHAVFDKRMFGPDSKSSININQISGMVKGVRQIETSLNNPVNKFDNSQFLAYKNIFEKSLSVNKSLQKGHLLSISDLESKKPGYMGIPASDYERVIGKRLNKDLDQWAFINYKDFL